MEDQVRRERDALNPPSFRDQQQAAHTRMLYAAVVENADDAVYSKDLEARITSWNRSAERIYGYSAVEAIGRHVSMLVPKDHEREEMRILDRITQGERIETYETERIRKNGVRIDVSLTVSPIESSEGEIVGASVVARDVTTAKRLAFLAEASAKLEALRPGRRASSGADAAGRATARVSRPNPIRSHFLGRARRGAFGVPSSGRLQLGRGCADDRARTHPWRDLFPPCPERPAVRGVGASAAG